jgi:hypothetical protein
MTLWVIRVDFALSGRCLLSPRLRLTRREVARGRCGGRSETVGQRETVGRT